MATMYDDVFTKASPLAQEIASYMGDLAASELVWMHGRIEETMRSVIDATWGEALEDGSVPSTKLQDKILAAVRRRADGE